MAWSFLVKRSYSLPFDSASALKWLEQVCSDVLVSLQDHVLWAETIVHQLPILGPFYIQYVRRWVGLSIVYLMYAVKHLAGVFDSIFAPTSSTVCGHVLASGPPVDPLQLLLCQLSAGFYVRSSKC